MRIGAVGFSPYIYNTNAVSSSSMNKIAPIGGGDDLLEAKTDISSLTSAKKNENPLRPGQSSNFVDILEQQMQMSRMNADRLMNRSEEAIMASSDAGINSNATQAVTMLQPENQIDKQSIPPVSNDVQQNQNGMAQSESERNAYQIQRAMEAYQLNITA